MANEAHCAERLLGEILSVCRRRHQGPVQIIVVTDEASRDGTVELIRRLADAMPELAPVHAPENRGVVDAYVRGYREALAAGADWILEIDAGYSHSPDEIARFLDAAAEGDCDCVLGTRFTLGGRFLGGFGRRYLVSRLGGLVSKLFLGLKLGDPTSGFQLFSRPALRAVLERPLISRGPFFQTEIKFRLRGFRIREVPIQYRPTASTVRSGALADALRVLWLLASERRNGVPVQSRAGEY